MSENRRRGQAPAPAAGGRPRRRPQPLPGDRVAGDAGAHPPADGRVPLPPIPSSDAHRAAPARPRRLRRGALFLALVALGSVALLLPLALSPAPLLVWNASASAPPGLYRVQPGAPVATGAMVLVRLPQAARALAARRRYLPWRVPAVKRIAASAGARVCARGGTILIDGRRVATRLAADRRGRPLPWWRGCRTLGAGEIFLLMRNSPDSFDGRYFGPSARADVIGRAWLLWAPTPASVKP